MRISVVLPQPDGPSRQRYFAAGQVSDRPSKEPKRAETLVDLAEADFGHGLKRSAAGRSREHEVQRRPP